jgi:hypothetical protein
MKKLSNQLFQNSKVLVAKGRTARQSVVDALDKVLVGLCPDGIVPANTSAVIDPLVSVIAFLEQIYFNEPCHEFTVQPIKSGDNVNAWIENRKALIKSDTEAFLISGYTVDHLYGLLKEALPDEFRSVIEKEYDQDIAEEIDQERIKEIKYNRAKMAAAASGI